LARLTRTALQRALFPVGSYTKTEIRKLARKAALPVYEKSDSQEICFIPDGDIASFIQRQRERNYTEGKIIDEPVTS